MKLKPKGLDLQSSHKFLTMKMADKLLVELMEGRNNNNTSRRESKRKLSKESKNTSSRQGSATQLNSNNPASLSQKYLVKNHSVSLFSEKSTVPTTIPHTRQSSVAGVDTGLGNTAIKQNGTLRPRKTTKQIQKIIKFNVDKIDKILYSGVCKMAQNQSSGISTVGDHSRTLLNHSPNKNLATSYQNWQELRSTIEHRYSIGKISNDHLFATLKKNHVLNEVNRKYSQPQSIIGKPIKYVNYYV